MLLKLSCTLSSAERPHSLDHNQLTLQLSEQQRVCPLPPAPGSTILTLRRGKGCVCQSEKAHTDNTFPKGRGHFHSSTTDWATAEAREALFNERCVTTAALIALPVARCHFKRAFKETQRQNRRLFTKIIICVEWGINIQFTMWILTQMSPQLNIKLIWIEIQGCTSFQNSNYSKRIIFFVLRVTLTYLFNERIKYS